MATVFACPACGKTVSAEAEAGAEVRCPLCGDSVRVPPPGMETAALEVEPRSSGMAVGALVCGILGCILCLPPLGVVGIILGIRAYNRAAQHPLRFGGRGYAVAGVFMGLLSVVTLYLMVEVIYPDLFYGYRSPMKAVCSANQRRVGQAMYIYAQDPPFCFPMLGATRTENDGAFLAFDPLVRMNGPWSSDTPSPTADLWSLIRGQYAAPTDFICPDTKDVAAPSATVPAYFDFKSPRNLSYSYQYQYDPDRRCIGTKSEPTFPILADANPYLKGGITTSIMTDRASGSCGNSTNHSNRLGQWVVFQDGHVSFEKRPDAGLSGNVAAAIRNPRGRDNIYTTHKPSGFVDPGDAAPTLNGTRGTCNLGGKSDACLVP